MLILISVPAALNACSPETTSGDSSSHADALLSDSLPEQPTLLQEAPLIALTPTELNNSYRDLLGFPSDVTAWPPAPAIAASFSAEESATLGVFGSAAIEPDVWPWVFPDEAGEDGFEGLAGGQQPSAFSVETVQKAATHFAAYALASDEFLVCDAVVDDTGPAPEGPTWADIRPILNASCGGCHGGSGSGGTDFAISYTDNLEPSNFCVGETVGACIISRIQDGSMPPNGKPNGVSGADLALIEGWVMADMPPAPPNLSTWEGVPADAKKSCGLQSVSRFAQRAWRRPLEEAESERLEALWTANWEDGSPEEAIVLTVSAILQSPAFLFRIETGEPERSEGDAVPLSDYEMASRLSFFLWDSMPDESLFEAAAAGELRTTEQVEEHARRLLDDDRARAMVVHFHDQLLETEAVLGISPTRRVYGPSFGLEPEPPLDTTGDEVWPSVLGPLRRSLLAETQLFVERTIFDGAGTLSALLTDNHGYVSAATEPLYGEEFTILPGPTVTVEHGYIAASGGLKANLTLYPAEFPAEERAGVLTLPSVLAVGSYAVHPAPILRGKRILERLVCQELGTPPSNADAAAPPDSEIADATNRERTEIATSPPECVGCHSTLNPPGFAFEHYDAMGRYRTEDNALPVDASGSFTIIGGETFIFEDGVDLTHQLSVSGRVHDCYTLRWTRYATGVQLEMDAPGLDALRERFRDKDKVRELLVSIATSDLFRYVPAEVAP